MAEDPNSFVMHLNNYVFKHSQQYVNSILIPTWNWYLNGIWQYLVLKHHKLYPGGRNAFFYFL